MKLFKSCVSFVLSLLLLITLVFANNTDIVQAEELNTSVESNFIIVLDPGHGGHDPGATRTHNGTRIVESYINLQIALACKAELEKYYGVTVYMTRSTDTYVTLADRTAFASAVGANVFISLHNNASTATSSHGAEVYYPNANYNRQCNTIGEGLSRSILTQLTGMGLANGGIHIRNSKNGDTYADGSTCDYYNVIRGSKNYGIPGIIVEHEYVSNASDALTYLNDAAMLAQLGVADATGIANYFGLTKNASDYNSGSTVSVSYSTHVQDIGWMEYASDGGVAGTFGQSKRLESIKIYTSGVPNLGVTYRTHVQNLGWIEPSSDNRTNGTTGKSYRLEAIEIVLTGENAANYDIYYRVHAQDYGWLSWACNGAPAGTAGLSKRLEAIQIVIVPKGTGISNTYKGITPNKSASYISADGSVYPSLEPVATVSYQTHVQNIGWQGYVGSGMTSGTSGRSLRLEGIQIAVSGAECSGGIRYQTHVQDYGWQEWVMDNATSGTVGQAKRLESIRIELYGDLATHYDVYYRVHVQNVGWTEWVCNGADAGTTGQSLRLEAIEIKLVAK